MTEDEAMAAHLAENGGDFRKAYRSLWSYYHTARRHISLGFIRGDTSIASRPVKPPPAAVLLPSEDSPNG